MTLDDFIKELIKKQQEGYGKLPVTYDSGVCEIEEIKVDEDMKCIVLEK